jgi:hypothetical protein
MCHDRGYLVTDQELEMSIEEFKETYGDRPISEKRPAWQDLTILVQDKDNPTGKEKFAFYSNKR